MAQQPRFFAARSLCVLPVSIGPLQTEPPGQAERARAGAAADGAELLSKRRGVRVRVRVRVPTQAPLHAFVVIATFTVTCNRESPRR